MHRINSLGCSAVAAVGGMLVVGHTSGTLMVRASGSACPVHTSLTTTGVAQTFCAPSWAPSVPIPAHTGKITCLTCDGLRVYSGGLDQTIRVRVERTGCSGHGHSNPRMC